MIEYIWYYRLQQSSSGTRVSTWNLLWFDDKTGGKLLVPLLLALAPPTAAVSKNQPTRMKSAEKMRKSKGCHLHRTPYITATHITVSKSSLSVSSWQAVTTSNVSAFAVSTVRRMVMHYQWLPYFGAAAWAPPLICQISATQTDISIPILVLHGS